MSAGEKILIFLGSKWHALFWVVASAIAMPFTFHNAKVVWAGKDALQGVGGATGALVWIMVAVFIVNILLMAFALIKFLSMMNAPKSESSTQASQGTHW